MTTRFLMTVTLSASLIFSACTATPVGAPPSGRIPNDVRALIARGDTLLAYKAADLYGDSTRAAVIVVRHAVSGKSDYDFDNNPCELLVLRQKDGKLAVADRSTKAVDCTYNDVARNAQAMSLDDNLTATAASIVYVNQKDKGDSTFYFTWSREKNAWYLQRATASNPDEDGVANISASYPKDFAWTAMSSVDPDATAQILEKHANASR